MRKELKDVVNHTGALGFIEVIKIIGNNEGTFIESMDEKRYVVIKGRLDETLTDFSGECGLSNIMSNLNPMLDFPNHKSDKAIWKVIHRKDDDANPEKIVVTDQDGIETRFRLMDPAYAPAQQQLNIKSWDVTFTPSKSKINEFSSRSSLAPQESYFMASTENNTLVFYFGDPNSSSHGTAMVFAEDIDGALPKGLYWPIDEVKNILKFGNDVDIQIKFSKVGAMMITVKSEFGLYDYILPSHKM